MKLAQLSDSGQSKQDLLDIAYGAGVSKELAERRTSEVHIDLQATNACSGTLPLIAAPRQRRGKSLMRRKYQ
jgi:hypothetical protein